MEIETERSGVKIESELWDSLSEQNRISLTGTRWGAEIQVGK